MGAVKSVWDIVVAYRNQILVVLIPLVLSFIPIAANGDEVISTRYFGYFMTNILGDSFHLSMTI